MAPVLGTEHQHGHQNPVLLGGGSPSTRKRLKELGNNTECCSTNTRYHYEHHCWEALGNTHSSHQSQGAGQRLLGAWATPVPIHRGQGRKVRMDASILIPAVSAPF